MKQPNITKSGTLLVKLWLPDNLQLQSHPCTRKINREGKQKMRGI